MAIKFYLSHLFQSIGSSYQEYYVEKDSIDSYQVYTFSIIREKKKSPKLKPWGFGGKKQCVRYVQLSRKLIKPWLLGFPRVFLWSTGFLWDSLSLSIKPFLYQQVFIENLGFTRRYYVHQR